MERRMDYVDMARGVAMILVMTGHSILFPACGAMHIPTFFMLAGFVITEESLGKHTLQESMKKRVLRLLYPYAFYSMALFLLQVLKDLAAGEFTLAQTAQNLFGILYSSTYIFNRGENRFLCFRVGNEGLWFLTAMICACAVFYAVMYLVCRRKADLGRMILAAVVLVLFGKLLEALPVFLPWGFDIALLGAVFMLFGLYLREKFHVFSDKKTAAAAVAVAGAGFLVLNALNGEANMAIHVYGQNRILFLLSGFCSSVFLVAVCRIFADVRPLQRALSYVGKNTLFILAFHTMIFGLYDKLFNIAGIGFTGLWVVRLLLTLITCLAAQLILEKLFRIPRKFL